MSTDLERVESGLLDSVRSGEDFLTEIASHLISAGGKRVRPGFCIASAATTATEDAPAPPEAVTGGVAVELVHLGSLYHDDVMDEAETRRTVESVNSRWGNMRAILAGDFLLARASELAAGLGVEVAALLAATIGRLCEGQLLELQFAHDANRDEQTYLRSIDGKTASLLASACRIGGIVTEAPTDHTEALASFGHAYGMAFQMVDDVNNFAASPDWGKVRGEDVHEGKVTYPIHLAMQMLEGGRRRRLATILADDETRRSAAGLEEAIALIEQSGALDRCRAEARRLLEADWPAFSAALPQTHAKLMLRAMLSSLIDLRFET